ncbi:14279_t:CDS:1, partial [Funneliformis mosseae]
ETLNNGNKAITKETQNDFYRFTPSFLSKPSSPRIFCTRSGETS